MSEKDKDINLRTAEKSELPWVNERYDEVEFVHSSHNEIIAIAEVDGKKAGLGRLVSLNANHFELGGMYTFESFRGRGIAKQIVNFLLEHVKPFQTVYCIPFKHLIPFYQASGFSPCTDFKKVPRELLKKYRWCQEKYAQPTTLLILEKKSY